MTAKKNIGLASVCLFCLCGMSYGAELSLTWHGYGSTQREISLSPGDTATIDVVVTLSDDDKLSGLYFANETAALLSQTSVATEITGWSVGGANGTLGGGDQQLAVGADLPTQDFATGPGTYIVASQVVTLDSAATVEQIEVTIATGVGLELSGSDGSSYVLVASGTGTDDPIGFFFIGAGSPGYSAFGTERERDPLIVNVTVDDGSGTSTDTDGGGSSGGDGGSGDGDSTDDGSTDGDGDVVVTPDDGDDTSGDDGDDSTDGDDADGDTTDGDGDDADGDTGDGDTGDGDTTGDDSDGDGDSSDGDSTDDSSDDELGPRDVDPETAAFCGSGAVMLMFLQFLVGVLFKLSHRSRMRRGYHQ